MNALTSGDPGAADQSIGGFSRARIACRSSRALTAQSMAGVVIGENALVGADGHPPNPPPSWQC